MAGPKGYNAQALVAEGSGVIVTQRSDGPQCGQPQAEPCAGTLGPESGQSLGVLETERRPRWFTADAGYCSEGNLSMLAEKGIDAYVATGRERHHRAGIGGRLISPPRHLPARF